MEAGKKSFVQEKTQRMSRDKFHVLITKTFCMTSKEEKVHSYNPLLSGIVFH